MDGHAAWPITAAGATATSVTSTSCDETYVGSATRLCNPDGTWAPVTKACSGTFVLP